MIRLLAVDIDGTLLDSRGRLPEVHHEALVEAAGRGVSVALVTGRSFHFTRPIVERLHKEINDAVQTPEISERIRKLGADPLTLSLREFDALIANELTVNAKLIKAAGIKAN